MGGMVPAGVAGEREHLPAGLRSSHGFCGSGSPSAPVAGREGAPPVPTGWGGGGGAGGLGGRWGREEEARGMGGRLTNHSTHYHLVKADKYLRANRVNKKYFHKEFSNVCFFL